MSTVASLPRWDMESVFPGFDSPEYRAEFAAVQSDLAALVQLFDEEGIEAVALPTPDAPAIFDRVMVRWNSFLERFGVIATFTMCSVTTDTRDEVGHGYKSQLTGLRAEISKLGIRFTAWIGGQDAAALVAGSEQARAHAYAIEKAQVQSRHQLSPAEEDLAADLGITGSTAWGELHSNLTSQLEVTLEVKGETKTVPMSVVRTMAYDPDREVRRAGYEAELGAWREQEMVLAACLNGIKGEVGMLCKRRKWDSPLDEAIFGANSDKQTIEAMMSAARDAFPAFRRYLIAKAKAITGQSQPIAFYDLFAPVGKDSKAWTWDEGCEFVAAQFHTYSTKMGEFAERSYRERWIDAEPRPGKVDGAYCAGLRKDESRILMNFKPAFGSVSTLAHELGHGYHNLCLNGRTETQRETPMTLAETASIFCETIIRRAGIAQAEGEEKIAILDASLTGSCQVVVDITSRFLFERSVFDARSERELSPREISELMLAAQRETYGDGMDDSLRHPYMWAAKPHYYDSASFYNYPYMYGLLFSLGLYAIYEQDRDSFRARYDDLLSSTGLADGATIASCFDINVRDKAFWAGSLAVIEAEIDMFESLVG